ncbi:hypothetical protein FNV43_RR14724 [Rhamnella rubrinervis]|uniref:Uncharacterized protein n=1 Tax=Rhamnella rubrinervis TaxID=2594499 RepID=A0A8K0H3H2_9ROSA|nr:hypothetical protein FNV43_RR14724 [Rhamnella rubrinervis]
MGWLKVILMVRWRLRIRADLSVLEIWWDHLWWSRDSTYVANLLREEGGNTVHGSSIEDAVSSTESMVVGSSILVNLDGADGCGTGSRWVYVQVRDSSKREALPLSRIAVVSRLRVRCLLREWVHSIGAGIVSYAGVRAMDLNRCHWACGCDLARGCDSPLSEQADLSFHRWVGLIVSGRGFVNVALKINGEHPVAKTNKGVSNMAEFTQGTLPKQSSVPSFAAMVSGNFGHFARVLIDVDFAGFVPKTLLLETEDSCTEVHLHFEYFPEFYHADKDNIKGKGVQTVSSDIGVVHSDTVLNDTFDDLDDDLPVHEDGVLQDPSDMQVLDRDGYTSRDQINMDTTMVLYEPTKALSAAQQNLDLVASDHSVSETKDPNVWTTVKRKPGRPTKLEQAVMHRDQPLRRQARKSATTPKLMNILYWNCRGFGNPNTQRVLYDFCRRHNPTLLCLVEPMVAFDTIPNSFWSSLNMEFISANRTAVLPTMWVFASRSLEDARILLSEEQIISVVIGDFNAIQVRMKVRWRPIHFFRSTFRCRSIPIDTHGAFFTWGRRGTRGISNPSFEYWDEEVHESFPSVILKRKGEVCSSVGAGYLGDIHEKITLAQEKLFLVQNIIGTEGFTDERLAGSFIWMRLCSLKKLCFRISVGLNG